MLHDAVIVCARLICSQSQFSVPGETYSFSTMSVWMCVPSVNKMHFLVIKWSTVLHMSSYTLCCDDKSNLSRLHLLHYYHQRLYKNTVKTWNSAQGRERGVTSLGGGGRSRDDNMWCGEQGAKIWLARSYQHCDNILKQCCDKYCHSIIPCSQIHVVTMLLAILFHHFSNIFIILPQYFCVCWEPLSLWPKS